MTKTNIYIKVVYKHNNGIPMRGLLKVGVLKIREDRLPEIDLDNNLAVGE